MRELKRYQLRKYLLMAMPEFMAARLRDRGVKEVAVYEDGDVLIIAPVEVKNDAE